MASEESSEDHYLNQGHNVHGNIMTNYAWKVNIAESHEGICEQAADHKNRYIQTIMKIDICRILFTLLLLLVIQPSSADVSGTNNIDLNLFSNCSVPLSECPKDSRVVKFREQCLNEFKRDSCLEKTSYLCGTADMYIIETCAVNKECPPGIFV